MAKRATPAEVWTIFSDAHTALRDWIGDLDQATFTVPSNLDGWTVGDLAAHTTRSATTLPTLPIASSGTTPLAIPDYIGRYAAMADEAAERGRNAVGGSGRTVADVVAELDIGLSAAGDTVAGWSGDPVIIGAVGPIRASDYLVTRVLEVVVHADDLAQSVPDIAPPAVPRAAIRTVVRMLLDVLAARHPGRSVEVRVPPFAAVQAVEGPRHTRGTPSNVVEMTATAWIRVAAGRVSWDEATRSGAVSASGERADLGALLPLV